jgi:hypothetical protein
VVHTELIRGYASLGCGGYHWSGGEWVQLRCIGADRGGWRALAGARLSPATALPIIAARTALLPVVTHSLECNGLRALVLEDWARVPRCVSTLARSAAHAGAAGKELGGRTAVFF